MELLRAEQPAWLFLPYSFIDRDGRPAGEADRRGRVGGADHGRVDVGELVELSATEKADVDPAGLQSVGNSSVEHQTIDLADQFVITEDDFVIQGAAVTALIAQPEYRGRRYLDDTGHRYAERSSRTSVWAINESRVL